MGLETIFRVIFGLAAAAFFAIRIVSQSRGGRDEGRIAVHEGPASLIAGAVAALTAIVFGGAYLVAPRALAFAYALAYPLWLRWIGVVLIVGGSALLGWAHHHLGRSFHSLIVSRPNHVLIQSGPYRFVRHPIYTAYLLSYLGGGLTAGNWVLTVVPTFAFGVLVALRLGPEEEVLIATFGERYERYRARTGALMPRVGGRKE